MTNHALVCAGYERSLLCDQCTMYELRCTHVYVYLSVLLLVCVLDIIVKFRVIDLLMHTMDDNVIWQN